METVKICLNKKYGYRAVGFAERLDIIQPSDFDDEPTLPYGLCQPDENEPEPGKPCCDNPKCRGYPDPKCLVHSEHFGEK